MKKHYLVFFLLLFSAARVFAAPPPASYYWVGGSGNWSDVGTHWATSSGGSTFHAILPSASDNVYFDANSFTDANQNVRVNVKADCNNMDWTGVTNNPKFTVNNAFSDGINIYGSLTFVPNMTTDISVPTYFRSSSSGETITTAGQRYMWVYFEGSATYDLQDNFNAGEGVFLNNGSLNTNNFDFTVYYFSSYNNNTRTLNVGSSLIKLSFPWGLWSIGGSHFTYTSNNAVFNITGGNFDGGGYNYGDISFSENGSISNNNGTFHNVSFAKDGTLNGNNTYNNVTIGKNGTFNGNNSFADLGLGMGSTNTFAASSTQTILGVLSSSSSCSGFTNLVSNSDSTPATISVASGNVALNYVKINNIIATGGATFTANNAQSSGTTTGWTISAISGRDMYWIGGTGNWSDGAHWSTTSGGPAAGCIPMAVDNVFIDANSFSAANQNLRVDVKAECKNMDWTGATNNPKFILSNAWNDGLNIYGSLTFIPAMSTEINVPTYFRSNSPGQTITTAGQRYMWVYFEGTATYDLQDNFNAGEGVFLNNGNLNTNNFDFTVYYFSSGGSNTRNLNIGSSIVSLSYSGGPWSIGGQHFTYTSNNAVFNCTGGNFDGGGYNYGDISFSDNATLSNNNATFHNISFAKNGTLNGNNTYNSVTFAKNANFNGNNSYVNLGLGTGSTNTFNAGTTQTVSGALTSSSSCLGFTNLSSSSDTTPATISVASGNIAFDFVKINNIVATGGANFSANNAQSSGTTTGWTISNIVGRDMYWIGGTGSWGDGAHWSTTSGGAAINCIPMSVDNAHFDANSFTAPNQNIRTDVKAECLNMDWTGVTNNPKFIVNNAWADGLNVYGSITFVPAMTTDISVPTYFRSNSPGQTITMAGQRFMWVYFEGTGAYTFQDNFNAGEGVFLDNGSLDTNNKDFKCYYFVSNNSNTRNLNVGSSVITVAWSYPPWSIGGQNLTYSSNNPSFYCAGGTFEGGGYNYGDISFSENGAITNNGGTFHNINFAKDGTLNGNNTYNSVTFGKNATINGTNTFDSLNLAGVGATYTFESNKTQTINTGFNVSNSSGGFPAIIKSNSNGTRATIAVATGTVCADFVNIQDLNATGGATFNAGPNSQNLGNNTGWSFLSGLTPSIAISAENGVNSLCGPGNTIVFSKGDAIGSWASSNTNVATINPNGLLTSTAAAGTTVVSFSITSDIGCVYKDTKLVTIYNTAVPVVSPLVFCNSANVSNLSATGSAIKWYETANGSALDNGVALTTGTYFASQTENACESPKAEVAVTINTTSAPEVSAQAFCVSAIVSDLQAIGTAINWYESPYGPALANDAALSSVTYFVSQTQNNCESNKSRVEITVNNPVAPAIVPQIFCVSATVADLQATETGVKWFQTTDGAALANDTALSSGFYYASQTQNGCESSKAEFAVAINNTAAPVANAIQTFDSGATIRDIAITGNGINWFASEADALSNSNALNTETILTDGTTYYATQTLSSCSSTSATAVTTTINLATAGFTKLDLKYYPNPVSDKLKISNNAKIESIRALNLVGQALLEAHPNAANTELDMRNLPTGIYILEVKTNSQTQTFKVVKK